MATSLPGGVQGADVTSVLWGLLGLIVTHLLTFLPLGIFQCFTGPQFTWTQYLCSVPHTLCTQSLFS